MAIRQQCFFRVEEMRQDNTTVIEKTSKGVAKKRDRINWIRYSKRTVEKEYTKNRIIDDRADRQRKGND